MEYGLHKQTQTEGEIKLAQLKPISHWLKYQWDIATCILCWSLGFEKISDDKRCLNLKITKTL